jgi:hypothetical protein
VSDGLLRACCPAGVAPEKLRRTPSLSALDELVMGRDSDQQQQCFVFMLKVGRLRLLAVHIFGCVQTVVHDNCNT